MGDALHAERHVLESEVRVHARAVCRVGEGGRFLNERPPFGVQVEQLSHYAVYRFVRGCRAGDDAGGICSDLLGLPLGDCPAGGLIGRIPLGLGDLQLRGDLVSVGEGDTLGLNRSADVGVETHNRGAAGLLYESAGIFRGHYGGGVAGFEVSDPADPFRLEGPPDLR